ncbi:MAG: SpoIIE family protein phosphatase [Kiritimatiellae bacterium]|nr:SpoIIE family protein phosphatase [Kiritimatiellia bacterium]
MKRRILIFGTALVLHVVLMTIISAINDQQARTNTEWQLDYSVIDVHDTVAGAIDTMLGHVARTAVRHIGTAHAMPMERMEAGAKELDIDEVNVVNREGRIIASNDPHCMGVMMAGDPVMDAFMKLTNGTTETVSQPFRPHARNPKFRAKYLAAAFPGGDGFVQVGLDERRLAKMLPSILGYIFDEWMLGRTGFFLCSDMETGRLISNPSRHRDEARTLAEAGYDVEKAAKYEIVANGKSYGETFVQTLFGEKCYCRAFVYGGHRFVAALPEREFYGTRRTIGSVFGPILFVVLLAFAFFLDRIFRDSDRLKSFYAAEDERRAKDMEIASTIQNSALPAALPENPCFRLDAAMQPAKDVGGDFYDYFMLDPSHLAFLVADVSGKGVTAALYMMTAKTLIKDTLIAVRDPAAALTKVNSELCRNNPANMFLTAWVGVLDMETGVVTFANAGHNPPVRIRGRGAGNVFVEEKSGPVLAFMDGVGYEPRAMRLAQGDALFLYTDGVTEALDRKGALFGEERLANAIAAVPDPEPRSLCMVVRAAVAAFEEGAPQADDITVLAVRYLAKPRVYTRSFQPTQDGIAAASSFLDEMLAHRDRDDGRKPIAPQLHIILDEICSNIVKHSKASAFEVDIEFVKSPEGVKLTFIDDGFSYDPLAHVDPDTTLPAEERPIGGLGLLMVKKMAASISYNRQYNRNFLTVLVAQPS